MTAAIRRVLLDECVPQDLRHAIAEFDVQTADYAGLAGITIGKLLDAAQGGFDVPVTLDRKLPQQQSMQGRTIAVVVLRSASNRLDDLLCLTDGLRDAIDRISPGHVVEVRA